MKRLFISALALGMTSFAFAQKGSILVGGDLGFNFGNNKNTEVKTNSIDFNPMVGYQFTDNWTAGVLGVSSFGKTEDVNGSVTTTAKNSTFGGGLFVRYSKPLSSIFNLYFQAEGTTSVTKGETETKSGSTSLTVKNDDINNFGVKLYPAVFVNLKDNFGLNFNFGGFNFNSSKVDVDGAKAVTNTGLTFGKTVNIGITKNF
ncbi:hypothetical protein ACFS6H_19515 [Terrimonas rubra]|uniref:Outer membrane protein beta-barrel domain-containing protein n=1 Tax=Terrimonas rubra TaxID=1035890 RepID=A0ABW6AD79_9BACT